MPQAIKRYDLFAELLDDINFRNAHRDIKTKLFSIIILIFSVNLCLI
jgi:hypothetical protein